MRVFHKNYKIKIILNHKLSSAEMKNIRANHLGAILNNNNEWYKAGRSAVVGTCPHSVESFWFYRRLNARWLQQVSRFLRTVWAPCLSATVLTLSLCVTFLPLHVSLSSNSVGVDGGEGVIELLKGDDSVTVMIESSHKRVLFVVAKIDVQPKGIIR